MRVANTEVAGLVGGLYEWFEDIGLMFFSVMIGEVRAKRLELEYDRVTAGAALAGFILGTIVRLFVSTGGASLGGIVGTFFIGAILGAILFLILASSMTSYVKGLRDKDFRSESKPVSGASFDTIFEERHKKYLESGYPPKEAYREAWWFATLTRRFYGL